jgi:hypothetical protein
MVSDGRSTFPSDIYFGTLGAFAITNGVSGDGNDLFICNPATLGDNTACRNRFFRDLGAAGLGSVAAGDFSLSSTPRPLPGGVTLVQESRNSVTMDTNVTPVEEAFEDDPLAQTVVDDTPQDQNYPEEITLADLPTKDEEMQEQRHQIFLPVVNSQ